MDVGWFDGCFVVWFVCLMFVGLLLAGFSLVVLILLYAVVSFCVWSLGISVGLLLVYCLILLFFCVLVFSGFAVWFDLVGLFIVGLLVVI